METFSLVYLFLLFLPLLWVSNKNKKYPHTIIVETNVKKPFLLSSRSFIYSGLSLKYFVYGVRQRSNFILLHMDTQFPPTIYWYWRDFPFPLCILGTFVGNSLTLYTWIYFWAPYCVQLLYVSVFKPVPYCFDYYCFV